MSASTYCERDSVIAQLGSSASGPLYLFEHGALCVSASLARAVKRPHMATVALGLAGEAFRLQGHEGAPRVAALKPLLRQAFSDPAQVTLVLIAPSHPHFRAFGTFPGTGVRALDRDAFRGFDTPLTQVHNGALPFAAAERLFDEIVTAARALLPVSTPLDARVERAIARLQEDLDCSLTELATATHLSYHRLSHLFSMSLGLPLRSYRAWARLHRACHLLAQGHRQAEVVRRAGFTDVSHFSRVCMRAFGVSPAALRQCGIALMTQVSH